MAKRRIVFLFLCVNVFIRRGESLAPRSNWRNQASSFASRFENVLKGFFENYSGVEDTRKWLKQFTDAPTEPVDGAQIVQNMSKQLSEFFSERIDALEKIVRAAEELIANYKYDWKLEESDNQYVDMRNADPNATDFEYNENFKTEVDLSTSGIHIPIEVYHGHPLIQNAINWSDALDVVFQENYNKIPRLGWQYFSAESGMLRLYPATEWKEVSDEIPDLYDARRRPWFVQSATFPKEMLIMMDTSGSVHGMPLEIMKLATKTLLNTLDEYDYVNVAAFREETGWVTCLDSFVPATSANKMILYEGIHNLDGFNIGSYENALKFAFKEFAKSHAMDFQKTNSDCDQVLMFFSDGSDEDPKETVLEYNEYKQVRIFSFGVGPEAILTDSIKHMACNNLGYYTTLPAKTAIRTKIQEYVEILSKPMALSGERDFEWTNYYWDVTNLGMVITVTYPIFNSSVEFNQSMAGVAGIDIPVQNLEDFLPIDLVGPFGYYFLINQNGFIIFHPHIATEGKYLDDPSMTDMLDLEGNTTDIQELRKRMMAGETGFRNINAPEIISGQNHTLMYKKTYFYTGIPHTPFTIALVLPTDKRSTIKAEGFDTSKGLQLPERSYSLAARKYCNNEITRNVKILSELMDNMTNCNERLIQRLLWDKQLTKDFKALPKKTDKFPVKPFSRFMITEGGLARIRMASNKESLKILPEHWQDIYYNRGASDPRNWTLSSNLMDDDNNTVVITALTGITLNQGKQIPAVLGMRFEANLFDFDVMNANEQNLCKNTDLICYLVDDGGYIIATNKENKTDDINKFLADVDRELMWSLYQENMFSRVYIYDYQALCPENDYAADSAPFPRSSILTQFLFQFNYRDFLDFITWLFLKFSVWSWFQSLWLQSSTGMLEFGTGIKGTRACVTRNYYYHYGEKTSSSIEINLSNDTYVRFIESYRLSQTNLLLIIAEEPTESSEKIELLTHQPTEVSHEELCTMALGYSRPPHPCHVINIEEAPRYCSNGISTKESFSMIVLIITYFLKDI